MNPQVKQNTFNRKSTAEDVTQGVDLSGKMILITGVAMGGLAKRGAHIIGLDRTLVAAETACASVSGETTPYECDLSDPDSLNDPFTNP